MVTLRISGQLTDITVVDYLGNTYNATQNSDGSLAFSLAVDTDGVSVTGTTRARDEDINVVYQASQIGGTETITSLSSTATAGSSSNGAAAPTMAPGPFMVVANLAVAVAFGI